MGNTSIAKLKKMSLRIVLPLTRGMLSCACAAFMVASTEVPGQTSRVACFLSVLCAALTGFGFPLGSSSLLLFPRVPSLSASALASPCSPRLRLSIDDGRDTAATMMAATLAAKMMAANRSLAHTSNAFSCVVGDEARPRGGGGARRRGAGAAGGGAAAAAL